MKILALNVRHGGSGRLPGLLAFIAAHDPDVFLLTEWRAARKDEIADWARDRGLACQAACCGATTNGAMVAARQRFTATDLTPATGAPGALLRADFDAWTMLGCYFPQGNAKAPFFDVCAGLAKGRQHPFLMIGDLNTGNQDADRTGGERFACADRFDGLSAEDGLVDLWRRSHGDAREWTWRSSKNGFRIDHALANSHFIDRFAPTCSYDHVPRDQGLSDHSAIVLDLVEGIIDR